MDAHDPSLARPLRPARRSVESLDLLDGYGDFPETRDASSDLHRSHQQQPQPQLQQHPSSSDYQDAQNAPNGTLAARSDSFYFQNASAAAAIAAPSHGLSQPYSSPQSVTSAAAPQHHSPTPPGLGHTQSQVFAAADSPNTTATTHRIKRKPLSSTASSLAARDSRYSNSVAPITKPSQEDLELAKPETRFSRDSSVDSPTLYPYHFSEASGPQRQQRQHEALGAAATDDQSPTPPGIRNAPNASAGNLVAIQTDRPEPDQTAVSTNSITPTRPPLALDVSKEPIIEEDDHADQGSESAYSLNSNDNSTMSIVPPKPTPPHLNLEPVDNDTDISTPPTTAIDSSRTPDTSKPITKSPSSSKFGSFFGWAISPSPSTTEFSSLPSPLAGRNPGSTDDSAAQPRKGSKTNVSSVNPLAFIESHLLTPPLAPTSSPPPAQLQEMEDELKAISSELAASIRREMDLEDLVDRLQSDVNNPQAPSKRTSDYFSDSGVSSTKVSEYDQNREEVEKIQRKAEQDKASIRLELTNKVQEERFRRKALDEQIKELSEKASQVDLAQINNPGANGRVKELETTCDDLRRKLSDEKRVKDNFEDLLKALRGELQDATNERDNLRDEVVPQLRARVEGLEAEASDHSNLTYESTKMQQELRSLKTENKTLRSSRQGDSSTRSSVALSRSNSVTGGAFKLQKPPSGLSRSNTVKAGTESREALAERLKDVEAQRDALHNALKNLLERQDFQIRESDKRIKGLEVEKDRLVLLSPGTSGFERDVNNLRHEVKVLRRRAEEAIEHKWQAEKGLVGLKMDLDRAEDEIASLRDLLREKDILIPPSLARASGNGGSDVKPATSASLEASFKDLQISYQQSLDKIKTLEAGGGAVFSDEKTQLAFQKLEQSLSAAVSGRDVAQKEASALKTQVDSFNETETQHIQAERALADELRESARRIEELATQVRQQLASNAGLRKRLAETVERGDADRKANAERITSLQSRLRSLEEQLQAAQATSEERVARHDEQIRELKGADNTHLRRPPPSPLGGFSNGGSSSGSRSPRPRTNGGLSPMPSPRLPISPRSPRVRALPKASIDDEVQVERLRSRVMELEGALADTELDMQEVIAKMSSAQIEVMTLQEEREAAMRETRRLQRVLDEEKVKAFEERFRTLQDTNV